MPVATPKDGLDWVTNRGGGPADAGGFLATHPSHERAVAVEAIVDEIRANLAAGAPLEPEQHSGGLAARPPGDATVAQRPGGGACAGRSGGLSHGSQRASQSSIALDPRAIATSSSPTASRWRGSRSRRSLSANVEPPSQIAQHAARSRSASGPRSRGGAARAWGAGPVGVQQREAPTIPSSA